MDEEEALRELDDCRLVRQACLEWLQQSPPQDGRRQGDDNNHQDPNETTTVHELFFESPTTTSGQQPPPPQPQGRRRHPLSAARCLDIPPLVKRLIFGEGDPTIMTMTTIPNANEAPEEDDNHHHRHHPPDEIWIVRPLGGPEIHLLLTQGCRAADWSRVYLHVPSSLPPPAILTGLQFSVSSTLLSGTIVLGWPRPAVASSSSLRRRQDGPPQPPPPPSSRSSMDPFSTPPPPFGSDATAEWTLLPNGIHGCIVAGPSWIQLDAKVHNNRMIRNVVIGSHAVVLNVGQLQCCQNPNNHPNRQEDWNPGQQTISVGPESGPGQRTVTVIPESTLPHIGPQLHFVSTSTSSSSSTTTTAELGTVDGTTTTHWSVVGWGALIRDTTTVDSVFLYPNSTVEGAARVCRTVLFPHSRIDDGSTVLDACLQWHGTVESHSYVSNVLGMEQCHIGPQSKVCDCILGPDVAVGSGEVQNTVLGPNTNAHHQSLLIGMIWLHGRGNVGYGANVGSNHTGRCPDQEAWSGEGLFYGLSNVIVYPVNLLYSPYSIVAAGTKLVPQAVAMPFSLFLNSNNNNNHNNQQPQGCEVLPGWVWTSSAYTLARCQQKWQTRRKAQRHYHYTGWPMLDRADVLQAVYHARQLLLLLLLSEQKNETESDNNNQNNHNHNETFLRRRASYLGHCHLSEVGRQKGIRAYTNLLQRSALHGLLQWLEDQLLLNNDNDPNQKDTMELLHQELQQTTRLLAEQQQKEQQQTVKMHNHPPPPPLPPPPRMPWTVTAEETWAFQKVILLTEFGDHNESSSASLSLSWNQLEQLLRITLTTLDDQYATAVTRSKQRDAMRAPQILPASTTATTTITNNAMNDSTIQWVQDEIERTRQRIESVFQQLSLPAAASGG